MSEAFESCFHSVISGGLFEAHRSLSELFLSSDFVSDSVTTSSLSILASASIAHSMKPWDERSTHLLSIALENNCLYDKAQYFATQV